jgi:hypothetical protein
VLTEDADRNDAVNLMFFIKMMGNRYYEWFTRAHEELECDIELYEMLLVTGCDYTADWANAVIKSESSELKIEVAAGVTGVAEGHVSTAIKIDRPGSNWVVKNWGPDR